MNTINGFSPKRPKKYLIKINDEVIDAESLTRNKASTSKG